MLLVVLLALAGCVAVSAQDRTFEETVPFESGSRLALETRRGSVRLISWDRSTVEIRARIEAPAGVDIEYARRAVEGTTIEVRGNARSLRIRSDYDGVSREGAFSRSRTLPRVHYEIRAPRQVDLDLDIDRSDTILEGFEGRLLLDLDRSDLEASDLAGTITLELDRGVLRANDLSGSIALHLDRGQSAVLDGLRGSFQLDLDRTSATMTNVRIDGDSFVKIDRGDLDLQLGGNQALTIDVDMTRRSDFSSDLPVTSKPGGRGFHGTINGGGPTLRIEADRSQIRLRTN